MGWWSDLKAKNEALVERYGTVAIGTLLTLSLGSIIVCWFIVRPAFALDSWSSWVGSLGAAWAMSRTGFPLRILGALVLTPLVDRGLQALGVTSAPPPAAPAPGAASRSEAPDPAGPTTTTSPSPD